jgi:hypothetical protein
MEARRGSNPTGGFADRLSPGESRAMASPIRLERMTCRSGSDRAVQLRHGDVKCAGKDSNLRVDAWSTARCSRRCATDAWGDRRVPTPLRPGSRPGSSPLGSATVLSEGIGPPSPGCGPGALPLS